MKLIETLRTDIIYKCKVCMSYIYTSLFTDSSALITCVCLNQTCVMELMTAAMVPTRQLPFVPTLTAIR